MSIVYSFMFDENYAPWETGDIITKQRLNGLDESVDGNTQVKLLIEDDDIIMYDASLDDFGKLFSVLSSTEPFYDAVLVYPNVEKIYRFYGIVNDYPVFVRSYIYNASPAVEMLDIKYSSEDHTILAAASGFDENS